MTDGREKEAKGKEKAMEKEYEDKRSLDLGGKERNKMEYR